MKNTNILLSGLIYFLLFNILFAQKLRISQNTRCSNFIVVLNPLDTKNPQEMDWIYATTKALGRPLDSLQVESVNNLVSDFGAYGDGDYNKLAYIIANCQHESDLRSIPEIAGAKYQDRYWDSGFYGRGLIQITWEDHYKNFGEWLGVDMVKNPSLALVPEYSSKIAVYGMMSGKITGAPLSRYINEKEKDFVGARSTTNGNSGKKSRREVATVCEKILKNLK